MDFASYLEQIRQNYGIRRPETPKGWTLDWAVGTFVKVADAMLDWKETRYDLATMKPYIEALMSWTLQLEGYNLDYSKGILFKGSTGKGKTFMLEVWCRWLQCVKLSYNSDGNSFPLNLVIVPAKTIATEYSSDATIIRQYADIPLLCIDDIGAESKMQNNFGNKVNAVNEVLFKRQYQHRITFGTTNLNELTAEAGYDDRLRRRLNEMFNVIPINHNKQY